MAECLFGIETEYAFTAVDASGQAFRREQLLRAFMQLVRDRWAHLPDTIGRGVFLQNGARLYVDFPDHPEFSTPECANPWDVVRYTQAGERLLSEAAHALEQRDDRIREVVILRCNVDYGGTGSTWGCHESYLHRTDPELLPRQLIPHLVSRVVYTGAGGFNSHFTRGIQFTLSPRVGHLVRIVSEGSTESRGIFHTKDESLASDGYHRLHILCGESVCSETAAWLKVGATALVVALIDAGLRPGDGVQLRAPLDAMRAFAGDPACRAAARTVAGAMMTAADIQRRYLRLVEEHVDDARMPPWADAVCRLWRATLDRLEGAPDSVSTVLDWAMKLAFYKDRARRRGVSWESIPHWNRVVRQLGDGFDRIAYAPPGSTAEGLLRERSPFAVELRDATRYLEGHGISWDGLGAFITLRDELFEIDARFGQLGGRGIFAALDRAGVLSHRVAGVDNIGHAVRNPPRIGRARLRGEYVRQLAGDGPRYLCDWRGVWDCHGHRAVDFNDPFATAADWQAWTPCAPELIALRERLLGGFAG